MGRLTGLALEFRILPKHGLPITTNTITNGPSLFMHCHYSLHPQRTPSISFVRDAPPPTPRRKNAPVAHVPPWGHRHPYGTVRPIPMGAMGDSPALRWNAQHGSHGRPQELISAQPSPGRAGYSTAAGTYWVQRCPLVPHSITHPNRHHSNAQSFVCTSLNPFCHTHCPSRSHPVGSSALAVHALLPKKVHQPWLARAKPRAKREMR